MDSPEHFLTRLLDLPTIASPDVRRGVFRQAIAALGQVDSSATPMALAGVDPVAFARSIQVVMADDLFEDLGFIRSAAAASAIHQMSSALPLGPERRALGRKVLLHLYKGDAETFATLASRMALGSTKALEGAGIRARVELCLELRGNADAATGRLALALALREELARRWVQEASTGSLPDRRMAAQLIERAAREAALRAERGDRHPLRIFDWLERAASPATSIRGARGSVATAWESLLADRESLVWRHVAVARGNLAVAVPELDAQIRGLLGPELSPTEWRRGATSLVASIAVQRARALEDALGLLDGPLLKRDPGIAMAMVWGVHTVAEVEPEAAEELLDALALHAPVTIAESLAELRARHPGVCAHAASVCAEALRASLLQPERDDGATALARALLQQLEEGEAAGSLGRAIRTAVEAFGERGTREAHEGARRALELATTQARTLAALDVRYDTGDSAAALRQSAMLHLRDLDANLFESQTLASLLLLDRAPGVDTTGIDALDDLHGRIGAWLLTPERREGSAEDIDAQVTLYQRELRTLLHLIDSGHTDFGDNAERRASIRQRWVGVVAGFTAMVRKQAQGRQTRALLATVARGLDALVRDGSTEPVDAFLFVATNFGDPAHVGVIAEASMHPEVTNLLTSYLGFVRMQPTGTTNDQARARIEGLRRFLEAFPCETTLRSEALRTTCATLLTSLEAVVGAHSLRALLPGTLHGDRGALGTVEDAMLQLQQLIAGAERRCSDQVNRRRAEVARRDVLAHAALAAVQASAGAGPTSLHDATMATARAAEATLPAPIALVVTQALNVLANLALDRSSLPPPPPPMRAVKLPDWVPARRIVGGFYVEKPLGGGNVGSVFVVTRSDERHERDAPRFALKVPEYSATIARAMSEADFLRLFREEAGALLAIPEHPNVAGFVTFDAGAKPKPILVMELVKGTSCERILATQTITIPLALRVLDGMLAGLEAMHDVGIAHLDVKPSNVILRAGTGDPVLVDFGLAGRKVRPGCATLCYGAPEIWEATAATASWLPASAADVYAFGCCGYEILTSQTLFDGDTDVAIMTQHVNHDGVPPGIAKLAHRHPRLAEFLAACLRHDPRMRASVKQLRAAMSAVRTELERCSLPLG